MPTVTIAFTPDELFTAALDTAREVSERVLRLADLVKSPLAPGETVDTRRHQIAKLGKLLAEAFLAIDDLVRTVTEERRQSRDVTAGDPKPVDPEAN